MEAKYNSNTEEIGVNLMKPVQLQYCFVAFVAIKPLQRESLQRQMQLQK